MYLLAPLRCYQPGCRIPAHTDGLCEFHFDQENARLLRDIAEMSRAEIRRESGLNRIYAIRAENGFIKFGISCSPEERFSCIQSSCPIELELLGHCKGTRRMEKKIHKILKPDHARGEWFHETETVKTAIEAVQNGPDSLLLWLSESVQSVSA